MLAVRRFGSAVVQSGFCSAPRRGAICRAHKAAGLPFEAASAKNGSRPPDTVQLGAIEYPISNKEQGGRDMVNSCAWIQPFSSLAHLDIGYSLLVIGYSLDVFHLFSAASAELIGHRNKFHINILQRAKTTAEQLNYSI